MLISALETPGTGSRHGGGGGGGGSSARSYSPRPPLDAATVDAAVASPPSLPAALRLRRNGVGAARRCVSRVSCLVTTSPSCTATFPWPPSRLCGGGGASQRSPNLSSDVAGSRRSCLPRAARSLAFGAHPAASTPLWHSALTLVRPCVGQYAGVWSPGPLGALLA